MEALIRKSQFIPIWTVFLYMTLYSLIETDFYFNYYEDVKTIDNILVSVSIICFLFKGYKYWNFQALRCFSVLVVLNILSEFSHMIEEMDYYKCYLVILCIFITSFILTSLYNNDKNGQNPRCA